MKTAADLAGREHLTAGPGMTSLRILLATSNPGHWAAERLREAGHDVTHVAADDRVRENLRSYRFDALVVATDASARRLVTEIREKKVGLPVIEINAAGDDKTGETADRRVKALFEDLHLIGRSVKARSHAAAVATHSAADRKLRHSLRSANSRLTRLLEHTQRLLEPEQEDRVLAQLLRGVAAYSGKAPAIVLIRRKHGLVARMGLGMPASRLRNAVLPANDDDWQRTPAFARYGDFDLDLAAARLLQCDDYFQMPLGAGNRVFGSLIVAAEPAAVDRGALRTLLRTAGMVLVMRRRERELRTLAERDPLTGLLNRSSLLRTTRIELKRHQRSGLPVSVVMLDLDHFKAVNDTHGHLVGDRILRHVARLLRRNTRESDAVARYGGEEFALVLPATDREGAEAKVQQILEATRELCLEKTGALTLSAGIAVYPEDGGTPDDMLAAADLALYEAKRRGRDCLMTYHQWLENSMAADPGADGHDFDSSSESP